MSVEVITYLLPPTLLTPNSPLPVLHYPGYFNSPGMLTALNVHDTYTSNGWDTQWVVRYGSTQQAHYHSDAHEVMTVLTGQATVRFGLTDNDEGAYDPAHTAPGTQVSSVHGRVEILAQPGDVFILPAGVAHKTFHALPEAEFEVLTPGNARRIGSTPDETRRILSSIQLSGFTMIGGYPHGSTWDALYGGDSRAVFERAWQTPIPDRDPVLGTSRYGLVRKWRE